MIAIRFSIPLFRLGTLYSLLQWILVFGVYTRSCTWN